MNIGVHERVQLCCTVQDRLAEVQDLIPVIHWNYDCSSCEIKYFIVVYYLYNSVHT